jgi:hypothetical protein
VAPGSAILTGPGGCRSRAFSVWVSGRQIARVTFSLDGHRIAIVRKPDSHGRYLVRVNPSYRSFGAHVLVARAVFTADSGTKAKTMRLVFHRCRPAKPRFTG